jgi:hypothetical protein
MAPGALQLAFAADAADDAAVERVDVVGQVADEQQRRGVGAAYEQRHRPGGVPGRRQQHQRAVAEDVVAGGERSQPGVAQCREVDRGPPQAGQVDVLTQEPAGFGERPLQRPPLVG